MSSNFRAPFVRSVDCRRKLVSRNEVVSFEIVHALIEPVVHGAYSIIRTVQLMQLECERALTLKIRPRDVHLGTSHCAGIDVLLDFEISVWLQRSAGPNRRDSGRQIQPWEAET